MPEITLNINGVTLTVHTPTEDPWTSSKKSVQNQKLRWAALATRGNPSTTITRLP